MAMALRGLAAVVDLPRQRSLGEHAGVAAEAHRAALLREPALRCHEVDDGMGRLRVDLRRVGPLEAADVPRVLDDRHLHAEADAEERDLVLARVAHGRDLALGAARPEAHRHEDRVRAPYAVREPLLLDLL